MSTSPQTEETAQDPQLQEQEKEQNQPPTQTQTQDTKAGDDEQEQKNHEENTQDEETLEEETVEEEKNEDKNEEKEEEQKEEEEQEQEEEQEEEEELEQEEESVKTPAKAATAGPQRTPIHTKSTPKAATSATKRKFDALHARSSATEPSISEHEKNKKARVSALMKSPAMRVNPAAKKVTKTREFSFARPTMSSALRTEAAALDHAQAKAKAKPVLPPAHKPLHTKRTPAKTYHASTPGSKTPATDKTSRAHVGYTPYTGPLPPLTVESSFAPKGSQHTAPPAWTKTAGSAARKPRPASVKKTSTGKENSAVNTIGGAATNDATSSSKRHRTPIKSSSVNKEENRSAFKGKVKQQRSRATLTASTEEPTV